jgi:NAD(P)-dependent dehydrogenase (short-subunit alcohol dehydrogenase family)
MSSGSEGRDRAEPTAGDSPGVALVVGAGDGAGGAIARRFARAGHAICVVRRGADKLAGLVSQIESDGGVAHPFGVDATVEDEVIALFDRIEREIGALEVVVYNAAIGAVSDIAELPAETFRAVWEVDCFGGFLVGREAARRMLPRERGTIFFTGATSALRGKGRFAAFAAAKHGLRALAQSMARELGAKGIHVAHVVIDGPIDGRFVRETFPDLVEARPKDGILAPDDIAESYFAIHRQRRSAWTHEIDLRPWVEPW